MKPSTIHWLLYAILYWTHLTFYQFSETKSIQPSYNIGIVFHGFHHFQASLFASTCSLIFDGRCWKPIFRDALAMFGNLFATFGSFGFEGFPFATLWLPLARPSVSFSHFCDSMASFLVHLMSFQWKPNKTHVIG